MVSTGGAGATDVLAGGVGAGVVAAATKIEALVLFDTCMETLFLRSQYSIGIKLNAH
jgi:hypothetical protein